VAGKLASARRSTPSVELASETVTSRVIAFRVSGNAVSYQIGGVYLPLGTDFTSYLLLNAVPHQQKAGASESGGNQQHGEQKLGAHPKFQHERSLQRPARRKSRNKLVAHAVNRPEVYRIGWVLLQLLPQFQNVVVDGARGRIILVAPDFIQQFVARNHALRILQ